MSDRVSIAGLATAIDRRPSTIRTWCRFGRLPEHLRPTRRDGDGWRFWSPEQVEGIKAWMRQEGMAPGAGLRNFDPTDEQSDDFLARLRAPRSN